MSITRIQSVSGYSYIGCFRTSVITVPEVSTLSVLQATFHPFNRLIPQFCCDWCAHVDPQYTFCGVQQHSLCICDNSTPSNIDSYTAPASDCNLTCDGDAFVCGGSSVLGLYQATIPITSTEVSGGTLTPQSLAGFSQLGCISDGAGSNRMLASSTTFPLNGPEFCCQYCSHLDSNNQWCGLQGAKDCWCGSTTLSHLSAPAGDCSDTCPGGGGYQCGGYYRMNLYRVTAPASTTTTTNLSDSTATRNSISATNTSGTPEPQSGSGGGLGGGAIAGIVVGVLALVALFAAVTFFLLRRRRSRMSSGYTAGDTSKGQGATAEMLTQANTHELQGSWQRRAEADVMPGQDMRTYELPSTTRIVALE